jgi:hypothetical protein
MTIGYVLFGVNVAAMLDAPESVTPYLNAFLIAAMVVLGVEWLVRLLLQPMTGWLLLGLDAVLVHPSSPFHSMHYPRLEI